MWIVASKKIKHISVTATATATAMATANFIILQDLECPRPWISPTGGVGGRTHKHTENQTVRRTSQLIEK